MAAAPALASARRCTGCGWGGVVVVVVGGGGGRVEEAVACRYFCDRCDDGINAAVGGACACECVTPPSAGAGAALHRLTKWQRCNICKTAVSHHTHQGLGLGTQRRGCWRAGRLKMVEVCVLSTGLPCETTMAP
jgi:hypothetical protein